MIGKLFFVTIFVVIGVSFAAESNPCAYRRGPHFARNPRGKRKFTNKL